MQVLFVDDDQVVTQSVQLVLQEKGYTCQTADLGADAIKLATKNQYDVIVLDIGLPDMDGFHVIRRLKMDGVKTPLLLQSGIAGKDLPAEAVALGVTDFLAKPFSVNELISRMEAVIAGSDQGPAQSAEPEPQAESPPSTGAAEQPSAKVAPSPPPALGPAAGREVPVAQAPEPEGANRRRGERTNVFEAALITDQGPPIPCAILNMSETGAAVRLSVPDQSCPTLFTLRPLEGPPRRCEVRWRRDDQIGVEFV